MAIKVHGATVIDNSKHITVSGAQVDGTLLLPEAGLLQVSKDNGSVGQFGASDTELITIGNSSNSKNIILRSSGFADFKQVNVSQILKVGGDNVQIDPDGSATFASHQFRVETSGETIIDSPAVAAGSALFSCRSALNSGNIVASITADGSAIFAGTVDAAGLTVNGSPVSGNVDLSGYDTSAEVDAKISAISSVDLSGYDTSTEVDAKIAAIPPVDLAGYDTSAQVNAKIANLENALINGAPEALNTLVELSTALGDDANFATTVTNSLAGKADLSGATFSGNIKLGDNNRLKFGNSDDLQIYHDGNNSIIREPGAGQLYLESAGTIAIRNTDSVTINASFHAGSQGQQLFHQGSKKFETTSTGINVTGNVEATTAVFSGTVDAAGFTVNGSPLQVSGSQTIISDTAPSTTTNDVGTLWWNSDSSDGSLYVLYQDPSGPAGDAGGKYWIETSPAPDSIGFNGSYTGDSVFNGNVDVTGNVTATYFMGNLSGNLLNSQGQVVIDANNPDFGLPFSGGTMTGAIQMGATASSDGGSVYFDGNGDSLSVADNADFDFGTGDFTIELFANTSAGIATNPVLIGASGGWYIQIKTNGTILEFYDGSTSIQATGLDLKGAWHHIAVTKESNVVKIFVDGVLKSTASNSNIINLANTLYIGNHGGGSLHYLGYISNVRVIKGTSLYAVDFTPSTSDLTAIPGTSLLCCQSKDSETEEATGKTISINGNTASSTESPFSGPAPSVIGVDGNATFAGTVNATYFVGDLSGKLLNSQGQVVIDADNPDFGFDGNLTGDLDVTGNASFGGNVLSLGVTPEAWHSGVTRALRIGAGGAISSQINNRITEITTNAWHSGTSWKYIANDSATNYYQYLGEHVFNVAPSGTANNDITFTDILRINSSGINVTGSGTFAGTHRAVAASGAAGGYRHAHTDGGYYLQDDSGNSPVALYPSGRALLAGGDIDLESDGSASFAGGDLTINNSGNVLCQRSGSSGFVKLTSTGLLKVRGAATASVFTIEDSATSLAKVNVMGDGSASFGSGTLTIGSTGWLQTSQEITSDRTGGNVFRGKLNGTVTSAIAADGSAHFASHLITGSANSVTSTSEHGSYIGEGVVVNAIQPDANSAGQERVWLGKLANVTKSEIFKDGSASFASYVQSGGDPWQGAAVGTKLYADGSIATNQTIGTNKSISVFNGGTNQTAYIQADGSATFAGTQFAIGNDGTLTLATNDGGSGIIQSTNWSIDGNGSAIFESSVTSKYSGQGQVQTAASIVHGVMVKDTGGNINATLDWDGSATFVGGLAKIDQWGQIQVNTPNSTGYAYQSRILDGEATCHIAGDGSAYFAGVVAAAGLTPGYITATMPSGENADSWGVITGRSDASTVTSQIKADGSATFQGNGFFHKSVGLVNGYGAGTDAGAALYTRNAANDTTTFKVNYNGSTTFGDEGSGNYAALASTSLGFYQSNSANIYLNGSNGNATFASEVVAGVRDSQGVFMTSGGALESFVGGNRVYNLGSNGSAAFTGNVEARNFDAKRPSGSTSDVFAGWQGTSVTSQIFANGKATFGNDVTVSSGRFDSSVGGNSSYLYVGRLGSTIKYHLLGDGSAYFAGNITAGNVSDIKFKENVAAANPQLADVVALGGILKNWDWKEEAPLNEELKAKRFLGLVAQEAEEICPGIVYDVHRKVKGEELTPETTDEDGNVTPAIYEEVDDSYKAINHDILVMKLLGAIAELEAKVAALEAG